MDAAQREQTVRRLLMMVRIINYQAIIIINGV